LVYDAGEFCRFILISRSDRLKGRGRYIRASEVAEYVYCARAWRLRVDGREPASGQARREAGEAWHLAHGQTVVRARRMRLLSGVAFALTLVIGLLILLLRWR
jgi:CRISPR/Cas system-associated exonuclease Cas4 (RecB family)